MTSRALAILIASALPSTALTIPMSSSLASTALVAGSMVTALAALALASNIARHAAVAVTLWVGLSAFLFRATMLDFAIIAPWTVATLIALVGPFSARPGTIPAITPLRTVARSLVRSDQRRAA